MERDRDRDREHLESTVIVVHCKGLPLRRGMRREESGTRGKGTERKEDKDEKHRRERKRVQGKEAPWD